MQIKKAQKTEIKGQGTFNNYRTYDEVIEYSFTTTQKLGYEKVLEILSQNGINLYGMIEFVQEEIGYNIEQMAKVFKYTAREIMC